MKCSLFIKFLNLPPGNCLPRFSIFIWFPNLPPGSYWQGAQPFLHVLEFHPGDCPLWYIVFLWFTNLPPGGCLCYVPVIFSFPSGRCAFLGWLITREKQWGSLFLSLSVSLSIYHLALSLSCFLSLSFSLFLSISLSLFLSGRTHRLWSGWDQEPIHLKTKI